MSLLTRSFSTFRGFISGATTRDNANSRDVLILTMIFLMIITVITAMVMMISAGGNLTIDYYHLSFFTPDFPRCRILPTTFSSFPIHSESGEN